MNCMTVVSTSRSKRTEQARGLMLEGLATIASKRRKFRPITQAKALPFNSGALITSSTNVMGNDGHNMVAVLPALSQSVAAGQGEVME